MVNPLSYFTSTAFPDSIDSLRPPFLQRSKQLLAPVRFGQGWSCYAINVPESTLTVMDPFLKADAGNIRIQWHQITAWKVLEEVIRCFDIVRSVDTVETTKWKVNIQLLTEVKCCT